MLPELHNQPIRDNKLMRDAEGVLRARLPKGWRATLRTRGIAISTTEADARLDVRGPDGRSASLPVQVKRALQPRGVIELRARLRDAPTDELGIVIAPYLSPAVRERLIEAGMGFIDLTGNIRIALTSPGLFIDAGGANVNPDPQLRSSRSLRGGKAGRIVRALLDRKEPPGVREIAELTGVNPGYVSRIVALLDRQALIERSGRGRIISVDWPRLLERWAEDAPLSSRGTQTTCLDPRGLTAMTARLGKTKLRYAVTGTLAVSDLAPVAAARLAVVYVENLEEALATLQLRETRRGANILLIDPEDGGVFTGSTVRNGLRVVAVSQAAADLLTSPGRGFDEAQALIAWMRDNEEVWRG